MTPVPSLAEIAADSSKIESLDGPLAAALGAAFSGLATSCALRAVVAPWPPPPAAPESPARLLSPKEAAEALGISQSTLLQESLPGRRYVGLRVDIGARRVRFSAERIASFLSTRTSRPCERAGRVMRERTASLRRMTKKEVRNHPTL
jgi:predicted DNA-binding transcriptional regulator AlpA